MKTHDLPAIGAPLQGGFYGGLVCAAGLLLAIVWAPKALGETSLPWHPERADVPGARSCCDSLANTLAMADAGSPLATWALGLSINGQDDWCLPARDVLELAYRHLKPTTEETDCYFRDGDNPSSVPAGYPYRQGDPILQTSVPAFQAGGEEAFADEWYWASTQYSAGDAWFQDFSYGTQSINVKSFEARARAVRLIQLDS